MVERQFSDQLFPNIAHTERFDFKFSHCSHFQAQMFTRSKI